MTPREVLAILPEIYERSHRERGPLDALLHAMADMLDPVERHMEQLPRAFDPAAARDPFVEMLAEWCGLCTAPSRLPRSLLGQVSSERLRRFVGAASFLARHRGTAIGLETALRLALDPVEVAVEVDPDVPHHIVVTLHGSAAHEELAKHVVECEKPAHTTYDIVRHEPEGEGAPERRR